jgi:carboxylate-amine ligase
VWWDVRPHPDFGTVELRMCDGLSNLTEIAALAALAQAMVHDLDARFDRGERLPTGSDWVIRENKWLAARFGLEAAVIVDDHGTLRPIRETIEKVLHRIRASVKDLGTASEIADVEAMLDRGAGYSRQRRIVEQGGTLTDVVHHLLAELEAGRPLEVP